MLIPCRMIAVNGMRGALSADPRVGGDHSVGFEHRAVELEVRFEGDFHHAIQSLPA